MAILSIGRIVLTHWYSAQHNGDMEPWSFEMPTVVFNVVLWCLFAAVPIVFLIVTVRPTWGDGRAYETSMRAKLPFGSDAVHQSVRARLRRIIRTNMWGMLGAILVVGTLFLATPIATTPYAMWILALLVVVGVLAGGTLIAQLRERLFSPAPEAPRVARMTMMRTRDYLGGWRTLTPVVLLVTAGAGTIGVAVATAVGLTSVGVLLMTAGGLLFAVAVAVGTRWAERRVLAQPQPASDTLELAWDDLFRGDALGSMRMSAAMTAWLPLGLAAALLVSLVIDAGITILVPGAIPTSTVGLGDLMDLFPWWGIPVLQVLYTLGSGKLPASLYPDFLRQPATAGAPA